MIRRDNQDQIVLICQHDHAQLAGKLVFHVGNSQFIPPSPLASVALAVAEHDCGWRAIDEKPALNAEGLPAHVFEIPCSIALAAWAQSVDRVSALDSYAGLLVSLHAMSLAVHAAIHLSEKVSTAARTTREHFQIQQFLHRQIEIQESIRRKLAMRTDLPLRSGLAEPGRSEEEDLLLANFHILQMLDQISLVLCFDRSVFTRVDKVIPRPLAAPTSIRIDRSEGGVVLLHPWPFDKEEFEFVVPARTLPAERYTDAGVAAALAKAPMQSVTVRLRVWKKS